MHADKVTCAITYNYMELVFGLFSYRDIKSDHLLKEKVQFLFNKCSYARLWLTGKIILIVSTVSQWIV